MLVLSRKSEESVVVGANDGIGNTLKVTVLEIGQGKVSLGFEANKDLPVHREEVWEQISRRPNNQEPFLKKKDQERIVTCCRR